jgi:DNA mismatch repair protein MSH6
MPPSKRPASSSSTKSLKQGSLFSFFSKKPADSPSASAAGPVATEFQGQASHPLLPPLLASAPSSAAASSAPNLKAPWQQVTIGSRVEVYWPDDKAYYAASVTGQQRIGKSVFTLSYDDGEVERVDLSTEEFRMLDSSKAPAPKRRRIHDSDDEEEFEYMMGDSASEAGDDESAYEHNSQDKNHPEDEEDLEDWMVTDDEEEEEEPKPATKKPRFQVTQIKKPAATSKPIKSNMTTPIRPATKVTTTKTNITPSPVGLTSPSPTQALPYVKGALNPAGSHLHNHLKFVQNPKDSQGRTKDDPNYDPRTLKVDYQEIERMIDKLTPASRQWWELKAQYFDTVLLFKTGKLYLRHTASLFFWLGVERSHRSLFF